MPFQFQCTCGLILSADESQQGRRTQCPQCHAIMAIPFVHPPAPVPPGYAPPGKFGQQLPPGYAPPVSGYAHAAEPQHFPGAFPPPASHPAGGMNFPTPPASSTPTFAVPDTAPAVPSLPFMGSSAITERPGFQELSTDQPLVPGFEDVEEQLSIPTIWHIPCPKGHILETPDEMLDQEVLCPYCQTQFVLKHSKSLEYIEKKEREIEQRDRRRGELWLKWSIGIAVFIILGLLVMIAVR